MLVLSTLNCHMNRDHPGRPRIEEDQPGLLETILEIVEGTSAADNRRRSNTVRTTITLDNLQEELNSRGYKIS